MMRPRARPQQAILLAVPPDWTRPTAPADIRGAVLEARRQTRIRSIRQPIANEVQLALPTSMLIDDVLPAGVTPDPGGLMYEWMRRLEPLPPFGDLQRGFAQEVADPLWMLAGSGSSASTSVRMPGTPVGVTIPVSHTPIEPVDGLDPTIIPAEAIVEGTAEDWWTPGRRCASGGRWPRG